MLVPWRVNLGNKKEKARGQVPLRSVKSPAMTQGQRPHRLKHHESPRLGTLGVLPVVYPPVGNEKGGEKNTSLKMGSTQQQLPNKGCFFFEMECSILEIYVNEILGISFGISNIMISQFCLSWLWKPTCGNMIVSMLETSRMVHTIVSSNWIPSWSYPGSQRPLKE